jgi:opacity protein-like surface antigen
MLIGMLMITCASIAAAQSADYKKFEVFAGYSHNRVDTGIGADDDDIDDFLDEREGFHGFNVSATGNVTRYIGFKFDVSGHFKSRSVPFGTIASAADIDSQIYNFLGGVQLKDNSTDVTFKPFAHALVGLGHVRAKVNFSNDFCIAISPSPCPVDSTESENGFAGAFGGGLDIRASDKIDIRVIQVDYNPMRVSGTTLHNFRFGVGIVFH